MLRKFGLCLAAALFLAGCNDYGGKGDYLASQFAGGDGQGGSAAFSYTHRLALIVPHGGVKKSFETARDACLKDKTLVCDLSSASLNSGENSDSARMVVALPHDKVAVFEKILTDSGASVQSRSTTAENVTAQASDNDRKIAQLTAWRDRLAELSKRSNLSVADAMKIGEDLSKVEADLEAALAEKRAIATRIAKETVTVAFNEKEAALAPFTRVFANAGDTLIGSTASAIAFLIMILPWLPIVLAGLWLIRWLWTRRKKPAA